MGGDVTIRRGQDGALIIPSNLRIGKTPIKALITNTIKEVLGISGKKQLSQFKAAIGKLVADGAGNKPKKPAPKKKKPGKKKPARQKKPAKKPSRQAGVRIRRNCCAELCVRR